MYEPGLEELLRKHVAGHRGLHRPAALHHLDCAEAGRLRRRALRLREHPAEARRVRLRHVLRRRRLRVARPAPDTARRWSSASPPCRSAARTRLAARLAGAGPGRRGRRAGLEPGVPARGLRRPGHPAPGPDRGRRAQRARREAAARGVRDADRRGLAVRRHRLPDRRAGEDLRELLPRHEDLLHQRDGRGVRGRRRRRGQARRGHRARRADRQEVPAGRHRLRRRLPAQGHPRLHGPRRRAGRRPGADLPARGRLDQHAAPRPDGRAGPRGARRRRLPRQAGRRAGRDLQAGLRRRTGLPGAERRRADPPPGRPGHRLRPEGHGRTPAGSSRRSATPTARWRPCGAPTWSCT